MKQSGKSFEKVFVNMRDNDECKKERGNMRERKGRRKRMIDVKAEALFRPGINICPE